MVVRQLEKINRVLTTRFKSLFFVFFIMFFASVGYGQTGLFYHLLPQNSLEPFTWTGLGGDSNWSTPGNWSTNAAPGSSDVAIFNDICVPNCNALIDTNISVKGVDIRATYSGTITQGAGNTITIGTSSWKQAAGTFTGTTGNMTFEDGWLTLSGTGVFTATANQTRFNMQPVVSQDLITVAATNTLTFPNGSTQYFNLPAGCIDPNYRVVSAGTVSFFNVVVDSLSGGAGCGPAKFGHSTGTFEVRGDFSHIYDGRIDYYGTYDLYGNVTAEYHQSNFSIWKIKGSTNTTYSGDGGLGRTLIEKTGAATFTPAAGTTSFHFLGLEVNTGSLSFPTGILYLTQQNIASYLTAFKVAVGTTVTVPTNSTVQFEAVGDCGSPEYTFDVNSTFNFENLIFTSSNTGCGPARVKAAAGDTFTVKKNLTPNTGVTINLPLSVEGSLLAGTDPLTGTMGLTFTGSVNATATMGTTFTTGNWTVNKPNAQLQMTSNFSLSSAGQALTITNGTVLMGGNNLTVAGALTIGANGILDCGGGTLTVGSISISGIIVNCLGYGYTWTGAAGNNAWNTAGNWSGNAVPGSSDVASFGILCTGTNCNANITSAVTLRGAYIASSYTGTINVAGSNALTIQSYGWNQMGGTFEATSGTVTISGPLIVSGGVYKATSGITDFVNATFSGTGSLVHNSGTFRTSLDGSLTGGGQTFHNISFLGTSADTNLNASTLTVVGTLTLSDTDPWGAGTIDNGTIQLKGNMVLTNYGRRGTGVIVVSGNTNQTITGTTNGYTPNLTINSSGGTVTITNTVGISNGTYTYTAGTVDTSASHLKFFGVTTVVPGSVSYNDVTFDTGNQTQNLSGGTMAVYGTLYLHDAGCCVGGLNNGTIEAYSGLAVSGNGKDGTAVVRLVGTANRTVTNTGDANLPNFEIATTGGTTTFSGSTKFTRNFTYTSGTVVTTGSHFKFAGNNTIIPGTMNFGDVTFMGANVTANLSSGTMTVNGSLYLSGSGCCTAPLNSGTILVYGNIVGSNLGKSGSAVIRAVGTASRNITGGTTVSFPSLEIATTGGTATITGDIKIYNGFTQSSGTVVSTGSHIKFVGTNTISIASMQFDNVTFGGGSGAKNLSSTTMTVNGTLNIGNNDGCCSGGLNSGTIEAKGNVIYNIPGFTGSAVLRMSGTANATISKVSTPQTLSSHFYVNKSNGAVVSLASNKTFTAAGQDVTVTAGVLRLAGYTMNVADILTVSANGVLDCAGGTFTAGSVVNNGVIVNCAGYPYNWTGASGDGKWSTAANWSTGVVPTTSNMAAFGTLCTGANCNVTLDVPVDVRGVYISSGFTGTITQGASTVTIGSSGWNQQGGTFTGSSADMTFTGNFTVAGGLFNATTGTMTFRNGTVAVANPSYFDPKTGTVRVGTNVSGDGNVYLESPNLNLYDFKTSIHSNFRLCDINQPINIYGTYTIDNFDTSAYSRGTAAINVYGNINIIKSNSRQNNPINIVGTGTQTITGVDINSRIGNMTIQKTGGTLTFVGAFAFTHNLTYVSGTVNTATSTIYIGSNAYDDYSAMVVNAGSITFNDLVVANYSAYRNLGLGTLVVNGNLTFDGGGDGTQGTDTYGDIQVAGNVTINQPYYNDPVTLTFIGSGTQTVTVAGTLTNALGGDWTVNKTGGSVVLASNLPLNYSGQDLTVTSGTLNMAGFNLNVQRNIVNSGTIQRGVSPTCGTITQGGTYTGNAAICP